MTRGRCPRKVNKMDIKIAREVAARVWCDPEMSNVVMDAEKAEAIAQILVGGPTPRAADEATGCAHRAPRVIGEDLMFCDDCNTALRR